MPGDFLDKGRRATYVDDLNRALDLVAGHFDSAWFVDHLQFGDADVLEGFAALTYMASPGAASAPVMMRTSGSWAARRR
jgi:hypothetical protein